MLANRIVAVLAMWIYYKLAVYAKNEWGLDVEKTILIFIIFEGLATCSYLGDIARELKAIRKDKIHE